MQIRHIGYRTRGFYRIANLGHVWEMTPTTTTEDTALLGSARAGSDPRCLRRFAPHPLPLEGHTQGLGRQPRGAGRPILRPPAPTRPQDRPKARGRNPKAAHRLSPPRQGQAPCPVGPLVPTARHSLALGLDLRAIQWPARPTRCAMRPRALTAKGAANCSDAPSSPASPKARASHRLRVWRPIRSNVSVTACDATLSPLSIPQAAWPSPSPSEAKSSRHTQAALQATLSLLPSKPQVLLSDNGSVSEAGFAKTLEHQGISRWYTYPKSPRMNAHIERFNRTLQEPSSMTTKTRSLPTFPYSTKNSPTGSSSTIPSAPIRASAKNPRYHSSSNIGPSAKGTGRVQSTCKVSCGCL